jgi:hypothetical protein
MPMHCSLSLVTGRNVTRLSFAALFNILQGAPPFSAGFGKATACLCSFHASETGTPFSSNASRFAPPGSWPQLMAREQVQDRRPSLARRAPTYTTTLTVRPTPRSSNGKRKRRANPRAQTFIRGRSTPRGETERRIGPCRDILDMIGIFRGAP